MNKKLLSALLAVMMVISMMACIAVPATAAVTSAIPVLTPDQVAALPSVQTIAMDDGVQAYKIETVDDLIYAAAAERYTSSQAYRDESSTETNETYENTYYNIPAISGQRARSRYVNPSYIDRATFVWNDRTTYNHLYLATDLDIAAWETATGKSFAAEYDNFMGGGRAASYYDTVYANIDGMGHKITGFKDEHGFAIYWSGEVKNLSMINAVVDETTSAAPIGYPALMFRGAEEGGLTLNNVDVTGANFKINSASGGGILIGMASNSFRPMKIYDCDISDSTIYATVADTQYVGLVAGLIASPASGYPTDCFTMENVTVTNSHIQAEDLGNYLGLIVGRVDKGSGTLGFVVNNLVVAGCSLTTKTTDTVSDVPVIANVNRINASSATDIGTVYVYDTTITYPNAEGTGTVTEPMDFLFRDQIGGLSAHAAAADGVAYTDAATLFVRRIDDASASIASTVVASNLDAAAVAALKAGSKYVIFETLTEKLMFTADATGKVTFDATNKAALSASNWTANGVPASINFDNLVISENTVYTIAAHTNHIEAIPGDNANHKVVCDNCSEAEHNYTVACADVTTTGTPVAGDYYNAAKTAYTCECGNTWDVADTSYVAEAPITVTTDAGNYGDNSAAVAVTVGAKADSKLAGFVATVTFDAAKLEYVNFTSAFNCAVNAANAANGTLTIAFAPAAGLNLNAEALVLNFQTKAGTEDTTATVNVAITEANVDTGSAVVDTIMPLTTTASVTANITHVELVPAPEFTAGDVNQDTRINLLDAVTVIQALKNALYDAQVATFQVWAADVDGDNTVTTNDVAVLLKKATGETVDLVKATNQPILSA